MSGAAARSKRPSALCYEQPLFQRVSTAIIERLDQQAETSTNKAQSFSPLNSSLALFRADMELGQPV